MYPPRLIAVAAAVVIAGIIGPTTAFGAPASASSTASASAIAKAQASKTATRGFELDFALPTGKSGCEVCHADPNLKHVVNGQAQSLYVNTVVLDKSAHAETLCTQCHADFAYKTPHANAAQSEIWRQTAKLACKNCHVSEFKDLTDGYHTPAGKPGQVATEGVTVSYGTTGSAEGKPKPLCGDCHQGHSVPPTDAVAARKAQHNTGLERCGRCHADEAADYGDYYHGAAYRRGAPDAPACWDCHGTHKMLPSSDPNSPTNPTHLAGTCSGDVAHETSGTVSAGLRCHSAPLNAQFLDYAKLIHRQHRLRMQNPVWGAYYSARRAIGGAIERLQSLIGIQ